MLHPMGYSMLTEGQPADLRSNLEFWTYLDRPDVFAIVGKSDDPVERMLSVIRWSLTKDLKWCRYGVVKPYVLDKPREADHTATTRFSARRSAPSGT